jgi:WD40 repeat protein
MKPGPGLAPWRFFIALLFFLFLGGLLAPSNPAETPKNTPEKIVVDWNGDGHYDLLLGDRDGFINLYLNEGPNESPRYATRIRLKAGGKEIKVRGPSAPCLVDWNEDGRKDLLVGDGGGYLHLFLNAGSSAAPDYASTSRVQADYKTLDVRSNASPCIVDWNGDGRFDLLVGSWSGELFLFLNEGSGGQPVFGKPIKLNDGKLDVGSDSSPDMADLNGDGKKDLIVGNEKGEIFIFLNIGKDQDPQFANGGDKILLKFNDNASPRVFRWAQSPLMDLVVVDRHGEVTLCLNKGQATSPAYTEKRVIKMRTR